MRRSSETIGALPPHSPRRQGELSNPEKSLVGTIAPRTLTKAIAPSAMRRYRPASTSCANPLAAAKSQSFQTTAIDAEAGWIRLTTVLPIPQGEWLSSEWPVCGVSEMSAPAAWGRR